MYTPAPLFKDGSKAMVCNNDVLVNGIDTVDVLEEVGKLTIGHDDMFINLGNAVDIVEHAA